MPLSSPVKSSNRAATDARIQAQIAELCIQRDDLIRQYMDAVDLPGSAQVDSDIDQGTSQAATLVEEPDQSRLDARLMTTASPLSEPFPASQQDMEACLAHANATVKKHIKLLHDYNEIKDTAQSLIGMIAEQRGVRVADVMEEMGVENGD